MLRRSVRFDLTNRGHLAGIPLRILAVRPRRHVLRGVDACVAVSEVRIPGSLKGLSRSCSEMILLKRGGFSHAQAT